MDFGTMPRADAFLPADFTGVEYTYRLRVARCLSCGLVQLTERVPREMMFHDEYAYTSSISSVMATHFEAFAAATLAKLAEPADSFVVEIGSNDGILLRHVAARNIRHLGVEPSANVAEAARARGVRTQIGFFDESTGAAIREEHGPADAIVAANVICHIEQLGSTLRGIRRLLAPDGVFVFEEPYVLDIIESTALDQIYDEHVAYFSAKSVASLAADHGLALVDTERQPTHGGSMRYTLMHEGHAPHERVARSLALEASAGLDLRATYDAFRARAEERAAAFRQLLEALHADGKSVVGYGATAKSCTMINFAGIGADLVSRIYDSTKFKQGKLTPGSHLSIVPSSEFAEPYPDYAVLFAWNHAREIIANERAFASAGGRWIVYVPEVRVLP